MREHVNIQVINYNYVKCYFPGRGRGTLPNQHFFVVAANRLLIFFHHPLLSKGSTPPPSSSSFWNTFTTTIIPTNINTAKVDTQWKPQQNILQITLITDGQNWQNNKDEQVQGWLRVASSEKFKYVQGYCRRSDYNNLERKRGGGGGVGWVKGNFKVHYNGHMGRTFSNWKMVGICFKAVINYC